MDLCKYVVSLIYIVHSGPAWDTQPYPPCGTPRQTKVGEWHSKLEGVQWWHFRWSFLTGVLGAQKLTNGTSYVAP